MANDISQWLQEIQALQEQIAEKERLIEEAHAGADRWREVYNKEAQQRRADAKVAQSKIDSLQAEINRLQENNVVVEIRETGPDKVIEQMADQLLAVMTNAGGTHQMRAKLLELIQQQKAALEEIGRLNEAIEAEKVAHQKTRQSLTNALADAVDQFKSYRATALGKTPAPKTGTLSPNFGEISPTSDPRNPSLQLPTLNQEQFPL